jgi:hypothetical protein
MFSSHRPDVGANKGKKIVDMLTEKTMERPERLGIIKDDRQSEVEQVLDLWEFQERKHQAFLLLEVRV